MNIVKTLCTAGIVITLGLGPAQAASVRLLDADLGAAAAYFSQLTGNSYIVEFDAQEKISTSRDDVDGAAEIHQLFVDLTRDLGARSEFSQVCKIFVHILRGNDFCLRAGPATQDQID